jgi:hypothetical protein
LSLGVGVSGPAAGIQTLTLRRICLKTIPPGGITCSIAASKKEAQAIMSFFSGAIVLVYET